jgi:hypothetical protein
MIAVPVAVWAACAQAHQTVDPKKPDEPLEVEVRFTDDSCVRMVMLQEKLEVVTKYGKLTIPTMDILKIDFGVHVPPDVEKKITLYIDQLGSDNYKARENALKELVALGPYAYPQLYNASKVDDPEIQKRASLALEKIKSKHPARNLRLREEDIITTPTFTIVGRICTPIFRTKSDNFGELDLKVSKLRAIRSVSSPYEIEVVIDAAKYGSVPNLWMETGYEVRTGVRLQIVANGTVNIWPQGGGYTCQAGGYGAIGPSPAGTQFRAGALLGRIGEDGAPFLIGERYEGAPGRDGKLFLHIVPSPWNNNSTGTYQVKITPKSDFSSGD